jgi:aryl-alcohol dehydrogenase-like predicted oxidoreductase
VIMEYGHFAGLERPISRLVMGTMVCTTDDQELTNTLLDAYVAAGGNCLDTAHVYGGGKSERAIGQWFQARNNRRDILLLDKGAHPRGPEPRVHPAGIAEDIRESLERLQTDTIDIYLLHRDDPGCPVGPIVDCLNAQREAGRIRVFGGSNWKAERIQEANAYAQAHGLQGFAASSPHFSLAHLNEVMWGGCTVLEPAERAWHTQHQFPLFPWSSQASGFFTGRYSPDDTSHPDMVRVYYNEGNWERLRRAQALAEKRGCSANNIALAYVLNQPFPVFALIGPRTVEELHASLPALDVTLTPEEMRWLNLEADNLAG